MGYPVTDGDSVPTVTTPPLQVTNFSLSDFKGIEIIGIVIFQAKIFKQVF